MVVANSLLAILQGSPVDANHRVVNAELRKKLEEMELQSALNGALYFEDTLANLNSTSPANLDTGFVLGDGTASNNGVYQYQTDTWVKTSDLPTGFTDALSVADDLATETAARTAADAALTTALNAKAPQAELDSEVSRAVTAETRALVLDTDRGEVREAWSTVTTGEPDARAAITVGTVATNAAGGAALVIAGTDFDGSIDVAPRKVWAVEAGRVYRARVVVQRVTDAIDPSGHAVEIRMQNLNLDKGSVSNVVHLTILGTALTVAAGRMVREFTFGHSGLGADYSVPATTRYALPFLRIYGDDHELAVEVVEVTDVTGEIALQEAIDTGAAAEAAAREAALKVAGVIIATTTSTSSTAYTATAADGATDADDEGKFILFTPDQTNSISPPTLSVNGGPVRNIGGVANEPLGIGRLIPNYPVVLYRVGTAWRPITDKWLTNQIDIKASKTALTLVEQQLTEKIENDDQATFTLYDARVAAYEERTDGVLDALETDLRTEIANLMISGGAPYATLAAGLAATTDGQTFLAAESGAVTLYRNDASSGTVLATLLTEASLDALRGEGVANVTQYASLDLATQAQIAAGKKLLRVDTNYPTPQTLSERSNVVFIGNGSFPQTNMNSAHYRRQVIPDIAPSARAFPDVIRLNIPPAASTNVVIVGDSLTTYGADGISGSDGFSERLERKLKLDNPRHTITVTSRGIGGTTYAELDDLPIISFPVGDRYPWYTDDVRPWLEYVEDLSPDVVVLAMGMNDKQNLDEVKFRSVVAKVLAMPSTPDIIFATNMVPSLTPIPSSSVGSFAEQEGRDFVAGYVRNYAAFYQYSLIDINRTFNIVRDGRDVLDTRLVAQQEVTFGSASQWEASGDQRCHDFSVYATIAAAAYGNANKMAVRTGPDSNNVVFINNNAGFVRFAFYGGGTGSLFLTVTSTIPTPVVDVEWEFSVRTGPRGATFTARIIPASAGAEAGVDPFSQIIIRHGGLFQPKINYTGSGGAGPVKAATLFMGVPRAYRPLITDIELWGDDSTPEGNGINHPTSYGAASIYGTHFSEGIYTLADKYIPAFGVGSRIWARVDGTETIGFGNEVTGDRLLPSNAAGTVPGSPPAGLTAAQQWECQGAVIGTGDTGRTTTWLRVR